MNRPTRNTLFGAALYLVLACSWTKAIAQDKDAAHTAAIAMRDAYWQCLAEESVKALATTISAGDFKLLMEGSCPDERQKFKVKMSGYMGLMYPDVPVQTHLASADNVISLAQADAVKFFIKRRNGIK